ncbi:unnamed protein product, partial [Didymodactylos carnosus]
EQCESPTFSVKSHTTKDARLTAETAASVEITVKCKNAKGRTGPLYADINGYIIPCGQSSKNLEKYYISLAGTHKQVPQGKYTIKLYDVESYSILRKARNEEAAKSVKAFGEVDFHHSGVSTGPWIQSEFFAAVLFIGVWWFSYVNPLFQSPQVTSNDSISNGLMLLNKIELGNIIQLFRVETGKEMALQRLQKIHDQSLSSDAMENQIN